jgi:hypothetical protein
MVHVRTTAPTAQDVIAVLAPSPSFDECFRVAWPGAVRPAAFLTHDRTAAEEIAQDALTLTYSPRQSADDRTQ